MKDELYKKVSILVSEFMFIGFLIGCLVGVLFMWVGTK